QLEHVARLDRHLGVPVPPQDVPVALHDHQLRLQLQVLEQSPHRHPRGNRPPLAVHLHLDRIGHSSSSSSRISRKARSPLSPAPPTPRAGCGGRSSRRPRPVTPERIVRPSPFTCPPIESVPRRRPRTESPGKHAAPFRLPPPPPTPPGPPPRRVRPPPTPPPPA